MRERLLWDRWDEVDRLLAGALDLPSGERPGFVRRATEGDTALRKLVLRLVDRLATAHDRVTSPSESMVSAAFDTGETRAPVTDLDPGTRIGRYEILSRRARGGMATVYEAERSDGVYRQRVALKVLRRGLDTDDLIQRFVTERQILSSLSHPNISRLLDGGSTPDGRPFLVMELVEGEPITGHADRRRLDVRARLALFLGVADAVHAAHRQLVVHRDIKPSNILVDHDGRVKLLDFGIAKLLAADSAQTEVGTRALTPEYASPEQLRGDPITTATDVYQLGLLLRELLTGVRPLAGETNPGEPPVRSARLVIRALEGSPSPSSRALARGTTPARLARRLRGDLDLIISQALRPEPEQRYASADELATDVRRHLQGLPIRAHPESPGYRMEKFVRRHRLGVAGVASAVLLLLGYAATVTVQNRRIGAERDRAEQEARKAGQVTDFLIHLFHGADPNAAEGEQVTARELLDVGARQIEGELLGDPAVRAAMRSAIGQSYYQLGLYQDARAMLEQAIQERRAGPGPVPAEIAADLHQLALATSASDRVRARALFDEALRTAEDAVGPDHPITARILADYAAVVRMDSTGWTRGQDMVRRAVAILRAAPGDVRRDLAHALMSSAYGQPPEVALPRMREALELRRAVYGGRHTVVATSLSDLALATEPVDPLAADSLMQDALAILVAIHGERHVMSLGIMNNLAGLRRDRGAYAEAEPLYRKVLALRRELYPEHRLSHAYTLYGLGLVLVEIAAAPEGEALLREALTILEHHASGTTLPALTRAAIGHAIARQARFAEAERMLLPANREIQRSTLSPVDKAMSLKRVAELYRDWGRRSEAHAYRARLDSLITAEGLERFRLAGR